MAASPGDGVSRKLACALVRLWARVYTLGLPAGARTARLVELESDLWESEHDRGRPSTAGDVLGRWLWGVFDDVRWRSSRATPKGVTGLALATTAAAVALWVYATLFAPQVLPQPHGKPMRFATERPAPPPPPPPPPPANPSQ
jgi:hypothetical protein